MDDRDFELVDARVANEALRKAWGDALCERDALRAKLATITKAWDAWRSEDRDRDFYALRDTILAAEAPAVSPAIERAEKAEKLAQDRDYALTEASNRLGEVKHCSPPNTVNINSALHTIVQVANRAIEDTKQLAMRVAALEADSLNK